MFKTRTLAAALTLCSSAVLAQSANAADYEVTITNITRGQTFTPQLLVTHSPDISLYQLGQPASTELEMLAEGGDTQPLTDAVDGVASAAETIPGLLMSGASVSGMISGDDDDVLSLAAMLIPTNDAFVGLNSVALPEEGSVTYYASAYDAGTERNDQRCRNIPGPRCGGEGYNDETAPPNEGYVYVHNGFHTLANGGLRPRPYDWRNPVAVITVTRVDP